MLEHLLSEDAAPQRGVVIGSAGFVGSAIVRRLRAENVPLLEVSSRAVDLVADDAAESLARRLAPGDALVFVSALAPCKDAGTLVANLRMAQAVLEAASDVEISHLVYISSDAVYEDAPSPLSEASCASAPTLHGAMHRAREVALQAVRAPLTVLRPSLLFGPGDPHNGYGPNRFRRLARDEGRITLFGNGEEQRDHVFIDDLAEVVLRVLQRRSRGVLNVATGHSVSFREIAERIAQRFDRPVEIVPTPRQNPITHRHFDVTGLRKALPTLRLTPLEEGLERAHRALLAGADVSRP